MKPFLLSLLLGLTPLSALHPQEIDPWEALRYAPAERGPLLVVAPLLKKEPVSVSLNGYTEAFEGRVFTMGNLSVLAPRMRTVLNTKPGKPNLFANMPPPERLKLFLGTCTEAQWKALGSTGLGLSGVTDEQKALFHSLLPVEPRLLEADVLAGPQPESFNFTNHKYTPLAPESLKLQIGLRNQYRFFEEGKKDPTVSNGGIDLKAGGKLRQLEAKFVSPQEGGAFGLELFLHEPNQLKPSALRYESLGQPVVLEGCKTVGEALARTARATKLELHADKRLVNLPLYLRTAPGQTASAGSVLQGLALGVTGTFRQLAPGVFLLTDDIEGIGSRWVPLVRWGQDADTQRRELIESVINQKRAFDPTALVGYRADDPAALPATLVEKLKSTWRSGGYALSLSAPSLPRGIQQEIQDKQQFWKVRGWTLDERVEIRGAPRVGWVLPSGEYVDEDLGLTNGLGDTLIRDFSPQETKPATAAAETTESAALPATIPQRLLALSLTTPAEATHAVREAKRIGITDLWVRVSPGAADLEPLKTAILQGRAQGITVGALLPLLRDPVLGKPEQVLTLQTSEAFSETLLQSNYMKLHPKFRAWSERRMSAYQNWRALEAKDEALLDALVKKVVSLPGLAGIAFKHTSGPGFAGAKTGREGIDVGAEIGYTPERRLAYLRKEGFDPIDFGRYDYGLQKTPELPFFPTEGLEAEEKSWFDFREAEVKARLKRLHGLVQTTKPGLPLFMSDRASDYTDANTGWYGSWDLPEKLPENPVFYGRSDGMAAARRASKTLFLLYRRREKGDLSTFSASLQRVGQEALTEKWNGLWIDLSELSATDAVSLLTGLPKRSAP